MNTYDTAALPLGTTDVKALYNNASNFDEGMNSTSPAFIDRRGFRRQTWAGFENAFADFLANSGYESIYLIYGAGVTILRQTQLVERDGQLYRIGDPADLPLTLTGDWATDSPKLKLVGDDALRQALANEADPTQGVSLVGGSARHVQNVAALRLVPASVTIPVVTAGYLQAGDGGFGVYDYDPSDTTTVDDGCTCFVNATDGARRKLRMSGTLKLEQCGAVGNGSHDDAIDRGLAWAQADRGVTELANGRLTFDAGKTLNVTRSHSVTVPIVLEVNSVVHTTHASGFAFVVAETYLARNTGWDIRFSQGARCINGNTSLPTSVSASGPGFLEIRRMQFSRVDVGMCIAYPRGAVYLNGSEDHFTNQHVQHNTFNFGQWGYNGFGLKCLSNSAETGGVQANVFNIQNIFANFHNYDLDTDGYSNTTSNVFNIQAADKEAPGGYGMNLFSSYNTFNIGFAECSFLVQASAYYNIFNMGNSQSSGIAISDVNKTTFWNCAVDVSQLPANVGISLDTEWVNQFGCTVTAYINVNLAATPSASSGLSVQTGRNSASLREVAHPEESAATTPVARTCSAVVIIPHGHILKFVRTGGGTLSLSSVVFTQTTR